MKKKKRTNICKHCNRKMKNKELCYLCEKLKKCEICEAIIGIPSIDNEGKRIIIYSEHTKPSLINSKRCESCENAEAQIKNICSNCNKPFNITIKRWNRDSNNRRILNYWIKNGNYCPDCMDDLEIYLVLLEKDKKRLAKIEKIEKKIKWRKQRNRTTKRLEKQLLKLKNTKIL